MFGNDIETDKLKKFRVNYLNNINKKIYNCNLIID